MQALCALETFAVVQRLYPDTSVKRSRNRGAAMYYFGIIFMFALGAGIGGNLSIHFGTRMIWVSCVFLTISFLLMFVEKYKHFHEEHEHMSI